jgi:hypothetical protein
MALPYLEGSLVPSDDIVIDTVRFWNIHDGMRAAGAVGKIDPTMPFFGLRTDSAGFTAILETGEDASIQYMANSDEIMRFVKNGSKSPFDRRVCAWPLWHSSKGSLGYPRVIRYIFANSLDYVGMAKVYREYARKEGLLRTLKEKAETHPQLNKIVGAPYIAYYAGYPHLSQPSDLYPYRYDDLTRAARRLKEAGVGKAFIHLWGGFKVQPPAALPFDEQPGAVDEIRRMVRDIQELGYEFSFYNDITAQLEEGEHWEADDFRILPNGDHNFVRWNRNCATQYIKLAERIFPELVETTGVTAAYVDCMNGQLLKECYSEAHPMDRKKDREMRVALYRYLHQLGLIFGGEFLSWWAVPEIEYSNGVGKMGRTDVILSSHSIPLFHLVFHDCVIPFCHAADDYTAANGADLPGKILRDCLYGVPPMFFINVQEAEEWHQTIVDVHRVVSPVLEMVADREMTHHSRTSDGKYQESLFGQDCRICVNFGRSPRNGLGPLSFRAECAGRVFTGSFSTHMNIKGEKEHE